ncbi:MAG: DNA topoisomerase VI subunit B [Enhygromyxa sp.]
MSAASSSRRVGAEQLGARQREISVAEFFVKNRHLLGFDSPSKAILTTVKEAVDNALDACEEAGLLPAVLVEIEPLGPGKYKVAVEDNGPGIVDEQLAKVFGKLLYGSKFHALRQSRGQQGLGISAAGMYGQLTTGEPMRVLTRISPRRAARELIVSVDTTRNRPQIHAKHRADWTIAHGTRVEIVLEGQYQHGQRSVEEFLRLTALANPHVRLELEQPNGERVVFPRAIRKLPRVPTRVQPHPHGVELGRLLAMLRESRRRTLSSFLQHEFSRVGSAAAAEILRSAGRRLRPGMHPHELSHRDAVALHRALSSAKVSAPDSRCIAPIGEATLLRGLRREVAAEFYVATTRQPAVYRGNPFVVEVALAYGKPGRPEPGARDLLGSADAPITVLRFANRVPLLFAPGGCAITRAATELNWRNYGLSQPSGALPHGPMVVAVHLASVWVPFTSESKEAIAPYPEIVRELQLALAHCGRALAKHIRAHERERRALTRLREIERYVPHIGAALQDILELSDTARERAQARLEASLTEQRAPTPGSSTRKQAQHAPPASP